MFSYVPPIGPKDGLIAIFGLCPSPTGAGITGIPLTSKTSGVMITNALKACDIKREDIYISNIVKEPTHDFKEYMIKRDELKAEIESLNVKCIICLGKEACRELTGSFDPGAIVHFEGRFYYHTYHPSFFARNGQTIDLTDAILFARREFIAIEDKLPNILYMFSRFKGKRRKIRIVGYKPSCYILDPTGEYRTIDDKKASKIEFDSFMNMTENAMKMGTVFEADLRYSQRFVVDFFELPLNKGEYEYLFLDIETNKSINTELADKEVISITMYSSSMKKYFTLMWKENEEKRKEKLPENTVFIKGDELSFFRKFIEIVKKLDPDLMLAWNSPFDFKYLINRAKRLGIWEEFKTISPVHEIYISRNGEPIIKGRVIIDLLQIYKWLNRGELESYSLESVAQKELGTGKLSMPIEEIWNDLQKLREYNNKDVELMKLLDEKLHLIEFCDETRRFCGCSWSVLGTESRMLDPLCIKYFHKERYVLPTKIKNESTDRYEGAIVLNPVAGIHKNIALFDLKSLYPSIICSLNMSNETVSKEGRIVVGEIIKYSDKKEGIMTKLISDLINYRDEYRNKMKKEILDSRSYRELYIKQYCAKVLANSIYGAWAYPNFRLYHKEISASITWVGREIILFSKRKLEREEYICIAGDTDSVFVKLKSDSKEDCVSEAISLESSLNTCYIEFGSNLNAFRNLFKTKFERLFSKFLIGTKKKRYAGFIIYENGKFYDEKFYAKGYDLKRSDSPHIARKIEEEMIKILLRGGKKKDIEMLCIEEEKKIRNFVYSLIDIGIPKTKTKKDYTTNVMHVNATLYSNKYLGTTFNEGSKFKVLHVDYVQGKPTPPHGVIAISENTKLPKIGINFNKMLDIIIYNRRDRFLEISEGSKQKTLEFF